MPNKVYLVLHEYPEDGGNRYYGFEMWDSYKSTPVLSITENEIPETDLEFLEWVNHARKELINDELDYIFDHVINSNLVEISIYKGPNYSWNTLHLRSIRTFFEVNKMSYMYQITLEGNGSVIETKTIEATSEKRAWLEVCHMLQEYDRWEVLTEEQWKVYIDLLSNYEYQKAAKYFTEQPTTYIDYVNIDDSFCVSVDQVTNMCLACGMIYAPSKTKCESCGSENMKELEL